MSACRCRFHLDDCTVHDRDGKRWDAYTIADVAKISRLEFKAAPADRDPWNCYCGRHVDDEVPAGTLCHWEKTSYEYDEWECRCADSCRDDFLRDVTIDWAGMARRDDRRARIFDALRRPLLPLIRRGWWRP